MITNCYTSVESGKQVACKNTQHYIPEEIYLLKKNFLGEFRTSLEKAKVRANLGIADSETLLWGNIQGDISNQTDIAAYINTLLAFDFNVEKDFDPGNDFENVKNVRQAAITCLQYLSKFKGEGEEIEATNVRINALINNLYGVESLDDIESSDQGVINKLNTDFRALQQSLGETTTKVNTIEGQITSIIQDIDSINNSLQEINNLIKISKKEGNALQMEEDGLFVRDLSPSVQSNAEGITTLQGKVSTLEENSKDYLTRDDFGSDDLNFISGEQLDAKLSGYIKTGSDAVVNSITAATTTTDKIQSNSDSISINKPLSYDFSGPNGSVLSVKSQADLLSINPEKVWKGMPVIVENDAIMYIFTKEPTEETVNNIANWKSADSLSIEVLTYDEYRQKKSEGILNPGVYYYIIEDEVDLKEIPSINKYMDENGYVSAENLKAYQDAVDIWYADAYKLHRQYMSALWGVEMEKKLNNKVDKTDYNYLKTVVDEIKNSSPDPAKIQELENKIIEILGDSSEESKVGRLVKVENNVEKIIRDLYATNPDGTVLEGVDPKFVTWEALGSEGGPLGEGESLFVKTTTYNTEKQTFLKKDQQASIPSIKSSDTDFYIEENTSDNKLITIKKSGEVLNSENKQLGFDEDIPYIVYCDSMKDYQEKVKQPITDNPNNKEVFFVIKDLEPGSNDQADNCYMTLAQFKQFAVTKKQMQDLSEAWGEYRQSIQGDGSKDQFGNQLYKYQTLSNIVKDWKQTVIPNEVAKQLTNKVDVATHTEDLKKKVDTTDFETYKESVASQFTTEQTEREQLSQNLNTAVENINNNTTEITNLQNSKVNVSEYNSTVSNLNNLAAKVDTIKENTVSIEVINQTKTECENLKEVTYEELSILIQNNELIPGSLYRMTDYQTVTDSTNDQVSVDWHKFDLILRALSSNTISRNCSAISEYYPKASEWNIVYSMDNSIQGSKGIILSMTDENGNYAPYDFKSIKIKKYKISSLGTDIDSNENSWMIGLYIGEQSTGMYNIQKDDFRYIYTFSTDTYEDASSTCKNNRIDTLGNIIFAGSNNQCYGQNNIIFKNGNNNIVKGSNNFIGEQCYNNKIDVNTSKNIIYGMSSGNTINSESTKCVLYDSTKNNSIGNACVNIKIGSNITSTIFEGKNEQCTLNIPYAQDIIVRFGSSKFIFEYNSQILTSGPSSNRLRYANIEIYGNTDVLTRSIIPEDVMQNVISVYYLNNTVISKYIIKDQYTTLKTITDSVKTLQTSNTQHDNAILELSGTVADNSAKLIVLNNNFRTLYNKLLEIHEELTGLITFDN